MKRSLGNLLGIVMFVMASAAYGIEPYTWSLNAHKSSAYVNEAVAFEYTCDFDDEAYLYVIELNIVGENEIYRLYSLGESEAIKEGKRQTVYRYLLFPKKAGEQTFRFNVLMRKTTRASIENSVIGRDNVRGYSFEDHALELPPLRLDISDHKEKMTGRFSLDVTLDKTDVKAYEPVHLDVRLRGEGDFDEMKDMVLKIAGVKVFSEAGEKRYVLTTEGYKGEWEQKFSIVAEKDFTIEPIELAYFDIDKKERVVLRSERFDIKVSEGYKREALLDDVAPEADSSWWSWSYLNYLFTLIAGIVIGRYSLRFKRSEKRSASLAEEVAAASSVNAALAKLVMNGDARFSALIEKYEKLGNRASLSDLTRELRSILKSD